MKTRRPLAGIPPLLWRLVSLDRHRLLMLDYDGTLAPFQAARHQARPLGRSIELLTTIASGDRTTVAIVSGRPVNELEALVGSLPLLYVGEHGWEKRLPDGHVVRHPLPDHTLAALDTAEGLGISRGWAAFLERKRSGVVLHTRSLSDEEARAIQTEGLTLWRPLAEAADLSLTPIDCGVELRAAGRDKGTTVLSLVSQAPLETLAVFVGDDLTDEDGFRVIVDWGFGVRVGNDNRPTLASGRLPDCAAVSAFLEEWLRIVKATKGAATRPGAAAGLTDGRAAIQSKARDNPARKVSRRRR